MGVKIFRAQTADGIRWGKAESEKLFWLDSRAESLADFLVSDGKSARAVPHQAAESFHYLSPVTAPCQIICQGKNYLDHLLETGVQPKDKDYNILFTKADSSLAPPLGHLPIPPGVRLLDYEVEMGLVIGKDISEKNRLDAATLSSYLAGVVICNDFSARDIQVPQRQWFKGKSFRGFCPVGPFLYLFDPPETAKLLEFDLELKVNGEIRQKANTKQLMHRPLETLQEIQSIFDLRVGDLLLTGTPGGVAMKVKPKTWFEEVMNSTQGDKERFQKFVDDQAASGRYLRKGDVVESTITHPEGIHLGTQRIQIS